MSTLMTVSVPNVIDPGVKKHFVEEYKLSKIDLGIIYKIGSQENASDEFKNYTGLAQLSPVGEGETYSEDVPIQAYGTTLIPIKYGKTMPVTYEMRKWSKTKEIWNGARMLGRAASTTEQIVGASTLNFGFNSAKTSYSDGKSLFATDHPRADGGTAQSNRSNLPLDEANLEVLILMMEGQLDDRGLLISCFPNKLVVPPALRKSALEILKSEQKSGSADNDINVYNGLQQFYGTMKLVVWDYLGAAAGGSDTAYFLFDDSQHKLMWQWAEKANVSRDESVGFKNDTILYKSRDYFSYGWADWRGAVGSTGA